VHWLVSRDLFTAWSRVSLEKLTVPQLVRFPAFHETRKFITVFTKARHLSQSWATTSLQSTPSHLFIFVPLNLILTPKLRSSKWFLFCRFPNQNTVRISLVYLACHRHAHHILLHLIAPKIFVLMMQFPPVSCYLLPLPPKCLPQHPLRVLFP